MEAEHQKGQGCGQRNSQDRKRLLPLPSFRQDRARVNSIRYGIVSAFVRHFSFSGTAGSVPERRRFTLRIRTARVRIILRWWSVALQSRTLEDWNEFGGGRRACRTGTDCRGRATGDGLPHRNRGCEGLSPGEVYRTRLYFWDLPGAGKSVLVLARAARAVKQSGVERDLAACVWVWAVRCVRSSIYTDGRCPADSLRISGACGDRLARRRARLCPRPRRLKIWVYLRFAK